MGNCWSFVYEQTKSIFILRKPENRYVKNTNNTAIKNDTAKNEEALHTTSQGLTQGGLPQGLRSTSQGGQETRIEIGSSGLRKGTESEEPYIRMRNDGNKNLPKLDSDIIIHVESDLGDEFVYVDA